LGDSLLLKAPQGVLQSLKADTGFIVTDQLESSSHRTNKIPIAVGIVTGVVLVAGLQIQPILVSALEGCVLMVLTGCLRVRELHESIRWDVIFLLAGIIPMGIAMQNTGAAQLIADQLVAFSQQLSPILMLGIVYLATTLLTELISNTATVVLLVPIVGGVAVSLGLDPRAFVLAVMFAASTSFLTPVGYQTNTMVFGPGGYKFLDFFRVGAPLNLILLVVTTLAITWLWGI
jgi:anion transporter